MATLRNQERKPTWALMSPDGSYHKLRDPSFFVGREQDVDLTLKSRSVDKRHAVIYTEQHDEGTHYIHDLESLNGTFVNEKRVQKSKLGLGDTVRFGYDMNTFRVDLYPCHDSIDTLFDKNNNNSVSNTLSPSTCYKEPHETSSMHHHSEEAMSRLCHSCGSTCKTTDRERSEPVFQGSTLYGQPSWWGWGSSDEEIYTYPNSATVVSQSGTLPSNCMVLQQRIMRNKANIEQHYASLKKPLTTCSKETKTLQKTEHYTQNQNTTNLVSTKNIEKLYNLPSFGRWETVPHGSYVQGLELDDSLENESYQSKGNLSYNIPFVPDFGELPEKPVSEKSRRRSNHKSDTNSSTSSVSENSDFDYDPSRTPPNYHDRVFGLTEVTDPLGSNSPKGVSVGKPKHLPVKIKPDDTKPSTPRSVSEKSARVRRNSSASSVTKDSSTKGSRSLTRAPSSGGSSAPSDNDSRGSGQATINSTSDDSDADNSPSHDKDDKRKSDKHKSKSELASPREVYSGDVTDKGQRLSSSSSSLPRVNKTALLRARNSREAITSLARRSSPLRSRATPKTRHRRSTPSSSMSSDSTSSSSLRIWSPSGKKSSNTAENSPRTRSVDSSLSSSTMSGSVGDNTQAVVDAIFEAGPPGSYVLPKELRMDRNDSSNKTFVLEDKTNCVSSNTGEAKTPDVSNNTKSWDSPVEDNLETLQLSSCSEGDSSKAPALQADRPVSRLPQPLIGDWMTALTDRGRSASPESLVSVPPASSPSPPSTPRTAAKHLLQERLNCCSAPPHARRQWDITEKPVEDLMLSSVHAFTVELRLASELVLSKARNLYDANSAKDAENLSEKVFSVGKQDNQSKIPEWKSSHAEIAGVFRNLRRVEFNLRTMDQALSFLCSTSDKDCRDGQKTSLPDRIGPNPRKWNDFKARARRFSWAEENRSKFPGPPSDDEEVTSP